MTTQNDGDVEPTPEERRQRQLANLAKAEQLRIDGARARADYSAENDAQNANMVRLRALRLAKQAEAKRAADEAAANAPPPVAKRATKKRAISNRR